MKIPFNRPFIIGGELKNITTAVMRNLVIAGNGQYTNMCQDWLEQQLGCTRALLTHSCTAALEMAAILCDIEPGDEVIMPSFTFVTTATAFTLRGGVPVFVDIDKETMNIDPACIEAAITDKTKVIVPVHYAGVSCDMEAICAIAKKHDIYVVEDAAQGLLSTYKDKSLGTIGDLGCLSFHETKNIISGEGGALLINNEEMVERAEIVWMKGTNRKQFEAGAIEKYTWVDIGSSYLPSDLIAAFLYAQMEKAHDINNRRLDICQQYSAGLRPLREKGLIELGDTAAGNGHIFFFLTKTPEERTSLLTHLKERGIGAVFHYVPLHSAPAGLKYGRAHGSLDITCDVSLRLVRLPLFYEMTDEEVAYVIDAVIEFYN